MNRVCSFRYLFAIFIFFICFKLNSSKALAQSCTFNPFLDGTLGVDPSELTVLSSSIVGNNSITATNPDSGSIDITCTDSSTQINISGVTQTNSAGMALSSSTTTVIGENIQLTSNNGGASIPASIGTNTKQTLQVRLSATYTEILKPGNYNFIVNLEALP